MFWKPRTTPPTKDPQSNRPPRPTRTRQLRTDGTLTVVCGASRSGKTAWTAQQVAKERRLLAWDAAGDWAIRYGCDVVSSARELAALCSRKENRRIAYQVPVSRASFDVFCKLAWVWVRLGAGALVVEELADVTSPGKAPAAWGEIVRKGLRYGPRVYALTQRPSESDKTALGNASVVHCGRMTFPADQAYMAGVLAVPLERVQSLKPLEYLERDTRELRTRAGRVRL